MTPRKRMALLSAATLLMGLSPAAAEELASASYRLRAGNFNAGAAPAMQSTAPVPRFESRGVSLGQSVAIGFASAAGSLRTAAPGFWPIVAGVFPTLDVDGDLLPAFADLDDDGDGLFDTVETNTGVFVSASDTGSDPQNPDSDGDGFADGAEVALGFDPNDPLSLPAVPALNLFGQLGLAALLIVTAARRLRASRSETG